MHLTRALLGSILLSALIPAAGVGGPVQDTPGHAELVAIHEQVRAIRRPEVVDGIADTTPAATAARRQALQELRDRFDAIDAEQWAVAERVDALLVRAQMNALDFELRVVRPWSRDPGYAVDQVQSVPYAEVPPDDAAAAALAGRLAAVPRILAQARRNLTEASAELAGMAIRQLSMSDGVNQGEPRRQVPPAGVIGWFDDLVLRLQDASSPLLPAAEEARQAVVAYRDWLVQQQPAMSEPAWVGLEAYDWYLRNVLLMPYDSGDLRVIGERELARARTFLAIERHRNRDLPPLLPAASAQEHAARVEEAEALIRSFIASQELLTIPADTPPRFETDAYWIVRPGGKRHFWEEITYRDPLNNHIHASIPGHRFDGLMAQREQRPVRRLYRDGVRSEGWAFYIEEMFLQAGLLDDRPRAKELFYIAQLKRAARIHAELAMQTGEFSLQDAVDYLVAQVPLMEPDLARYDLQIYLRRPTYGMNYVMGKVQLEQLLSDVALQRGDAFDLGAFHDEFLGAGPVPISLIRWEMTGLDDEIATLW